jgi:hypothetical protein
MLIFKAAFFMTLSFFVELDSIPSRTEIIAPTSMTASYDWMMFSAFWKPRICMMNSFFFYENQEKTSSKFYATDYSRPYEGLKTSFPLILAIFCGEFRMASTESHI